MSGAQPSRMRRQHLLPELVDASGLRLPVGPDGYVGAVVATAEMAALEDYLPG